MADDPWAQFVASPAPTAPPAAAPAAGGKDDPWAQFIAPSAAPNQQGAPAASAAASKPANTSWQDYLLAHLANISGPWNAPKDQPLGQTAFWNKPADVSWGQYFGAHLQPLGDIGREAANTFGVGDRMIAQGRATLPMMYPSLFGQDASAVQPGGAYDPAAQQQRAAADLKQERDYTAAAEARMPTQNRIAANILGYAPLGALGIAGRLGGGVLGTAAEGTTAGGLAAAGHDESIPLGMAEGGVGGAGFGALTKYVVNPLVTVGGNWLGKATGALSDPPAVTAALKSDRTAKYDALRDVFYNPDDLAPHLDAAANDIRTADPAGELTAGAPRSIAALNGLIDQATSPGNPAQTAHSVLTTIDKLSQIQRSPNAGAENDIAPIIKGRLNDFLASANPVNPDLGPGAAADMIDAAKKAHQLYSNADDLQQWSQSLKGFGTSPAGPAQKLAETYYNNPSDPRYKVLSNIAQTAGGSGQTAYNLMHMIDPLLGYVGASIGGGPGAIGGEIAGHMMKPGLASALTAAQQRATLRAIGGAYPALAKAPPAAWSPDLGPALRTLLFGQAASRGY